MTWTIATPFHPSLAPSRRLRWAAAAAAVAGGALLLALVFWPGSSGDVSRPAPMSLAGPASGTASTAPLGEVTRPADRPVSSRLTTSMPSDPAVAWDRRIIRQATLDLELDDVDAAVARLTELVEGAGGYVAETQVHSDAAGVARATVTAYVPSPGFGRALRDLEHLGRPTARRVSGQDVSEEFVDLEARVRNLERHEAQVLTFMGKAQKVADLLSLESELARVRGEIERLTGRLRFLRARSEMAGIQVSLARTVAPVSADGRLARAWTRVRRAFVAGWRAAFDVVVGLAAVAAQASPLALPTLLGWGLYRRLRRPAVISPPAP